MAKKLTEGEKLALADKMAYKLGKYIEALDLKLYRSELSEENWNKEIDRHPLFRGKTGKNIQKYIKHDPKNITKEELALKYKEDGNFYVQHKKFPMAVCIFTEGIKVKCEKKEVCAILYNNRSAANFFLKNYQGALSDAQHALKLKPDYEKARWRAAQCAFHISDFELAAKLSQEVIQKNKTRPEIQITAFQILAYISFMNNFVNSPFNVFLMHLHKMERVFVALKERRVKFYELQPNGPITEEVLTPKLFPLRQIPVHFDEDEKTLIWPVIFGFPEIRHIHLDVVNENNILEDFLNNMHSRLDAPLKSYNQGNINVYFYNILDGITHKMNVKSTVKAIVSGKNFYVREGTLSFYLVHADSDYEKIFLAKT